jgi:hypothetical protein
MSAGDRVLYWVIALLVLVLILLVAHMLFTLSRRLWAAIGHWRAAIRRSAGGRTEVEFYQRFCRRLDMLGLRRPPHQTPAEFAEALAERYPPLHAAPELVRLYYGLAFGSQTLSPDLQSWVERSLSELKHLDREGLTSAVGHQCERSHSLAFRAGGHSR